MEGIYLSTGTFVGRINGRNHRLITEYGARLACDGFEFMVYSPFYENIDTIVTDLLASGLSFPVVHADKDIGDCLSDAEEERFAQARELLLRNLDVAGRLGAKKMVLHGWGRPHSDACPERLYERIGQLHALAQSSGVDMLVENCVCIHHGSLRHMEELARRFPTLGLIIDTRCVQFHRQMAETMNSFIWERNVRHVHISDFHGEYMQWDALRTILQPPQGDVDWPEFFRLLRAVGYRHSITLEAPSMLPDGVDTETLNRGLSFIREGVRHAEEL